MTATTQLAMARLTLNDTQCEALFASALQPSDAPTADMVVEAINCTIRQIRYQRLRRPDGAGVR